MKTSIIVVTKNHEDFITECMKSLLRQDLLVELDYEIIVFDSGSKDNTLSVVMEYTKENVVSADAEGKNLSYCCNEALEMADGDYILRVDGDDVLDVNYLLFTTAILDNNETIDFVLTDHEFIGERKGVRRINRNDISTWLACGNLYRKSILEDIGGWNNLVYEEIDLHLRLMTRGRKQFYLPLPLYNYRIHSKQMSQDKELMEKGKDELRNIYSENVLNSFGVIFK